MVNKEMRFFLSINWLEHCKRLPCEPTSGTWCILQRSRLTSHALSTVWLCTESIAGFLTGIS